MRCRLRAGVALVVLGLMWGVLFLVPFAAPWIGFGVLGLPCIRAYTWPSADRVVVRVILFFEFDMVCLAAAVIPGSCTISRRDFLSVPKAN